MGIKRVTGDLFANQHKAQVLAHGVNCMGVMSAGIAIGFKARWPLMYQAYRTFCQQKKIYPGDVMVWRCATTKEKPLPVCIFNIASQQYIGIGRGAQLGWLKAGLERAKLLMPMHACTTMAIPLIGAGLGGLEGYAVDKIMEEVFGEWDGGTVYLYGVWDKKG